MREIVLDTETTGLDPLRGDRLVEIGCIELLNSIPSGQTFHRYLNPQRDIPAEAFAVHGLSAEFLRGKPKFEHPEVVDAFLDFVGDAPIVAHNAGFDRAFVNWELSCIHRVGPPDDIVLYRDDKPVGPIRPVDPVDNARFHAQPVELSYADLVRRRQEEEQEGSSS